MKVLLLNDMGGSVGGAELKTFNLRERLRARGHDARLLASSVPDGAKKSLADYTCFGTTSRLRAVLRTVNPSAFFLLRKVLTDFRPDFLHVNMFLTELSPFILPLLRHYPTLYHADWYETICPTGVKLLPDGAACTVSAGLACGRNGCVSAMAWPPVMLQLRLWRQWRGAFDLVVATSEAVRQKLVNSGVEPVTVIWNGVPECAPRPSLFAAPTVAFAGRMVREKGIDVLLRAFHTVASKLPDARLILAGNGPELEALKRLAQELGLSGQVDWLGHVPRESLDQHLGGAWVVSVPSRWDEPFGLIAAEAMMRGTAVVASASGGLAEIVVDGRTGFLVTPGDVPPLAQALLRILENRSLAEEMGKAGRDRALTHFSLDVFANRFVDVYEKLCVRSRN